MGLHLPCAFKKHRSGETAGQRSTVEPGVREAAAASWTSTGLLGERVGPWRDVKDTAHALWAPQGHKEG